MNKIFQGENAESSLKSYSEVLPVIAKQTPQLEVLNTNGKPSLHLRQLTNGSRLAQYAVKL